MEEKNEENEISRIVKKLLPKMAVLTIICFCFTLIWGFKLENLTGFLVGYVYVCWCYYYLGKTCERAVELDVVKAKRLMMRCYLIRYGGLFVLCALAMVTGTLNFTGILLPQFYPRIILTIMQFCGKDMDI